MQVAVAGITGNTGAATARALLGAGVQVRGITRDPSKAALPGAEIVGADLTGPGFVEALRGVDAAYVLIPPAWAAPDYFAAAHAVVDAVAAAVEAADVPRVVALSSIGVQNEVGTGPVRSLRRLEAKLGGRRGVTLLRPSYFTTNLMGMVGAARGGQLPVFWDPTVPVSVIDPEDIGAEAARLLQVPAVDAPAVAQITGPADPSFAEVAATFAAVLGRPVDVLRLPAEAVIPNLKQLGAGHIAELYAEMNAHMDRGALSFDPAHPVHRTGTPLGVSVQRLVSAG